FAEDRGEGELALRRHQEALALCRQAHGEASEEAARARHDLAAFHDRQGNYLEAIPLYREARELRLRLLGPDHPAATESRDALGDLARVLGLLEEAEPLLQEGVCARRGIRGQESALAERLNSLGMLRLERGDLSGAAENLEESLRLFEESLGRRHPRVAMVLGNLALLHE